MGAEGGVVASRRVRPRWLLPLGLVALLLLAMVVGGRLDDAPTEGKYRPSLPPEVFGTACDPLPDGVVLDLPVVLRSDRSTATSGGGVVRRLDLHYDLVEETEAEDAVVAALRAAGFRPAGAPPGADRDVERWFDRPDYGRVGVSVTPFDVDEASTVRGALSLDLPVTSLTRSTRRACPDYAQTKRFPLGLDQTRTGRD